MLKNGVCSLHDNMRSHMKDVAWLTFALFEWKVLDHSAHSPDLDTSDFVSFQEIHAPLRGVCSYTLYNVSKVMTRKIRHLNENRLLNGIQKLSNS